MNDALIAFFRGTGTDHRGRTLDDVLSRDDRWFETTHDFVQWLFPLRTPSGVLPDAPLLDDDTEAAFRADEVLQRNLGRAFARMLRFFGFLACDDGTIVPAPNFESRAVDWFHGDTHNNLRISRILGSLGRLGREQDALHFLAAIEAERAMRDDCGIGSAALSFWEAALRYEPR